MIHALSRGLKVASTVNRAHGNRARRSFPRASRKRTQIHHDIQAFSTRIWALYSCGNPWLLVVYTFRRWPKFTHYAYLVQRRSGVLVDAGWFGELQGRSGPIPKRAPMCTQPASLSPPVHLTNAQEFSESLEQTNLDSHRTEIAIERDLRLVQLALLQLGVLFGMLSIRLGWGRNLKVLLRLRPLVLVTSVGLSLPSV